MEIYLNVEEMAKKRMCITLNVAFSRQRERNVCVLMNFVHCGFLTAMEILEGGGA